MILPQGMVTLGLNQNKKGLAVLVLRYREFLNRIYGLAAGEGRGLRVAAGEPVLARDAAFIERAA